MNGELGAIMAMAVAVAMAVAMVGEDAETEQHSHADNTHISLLSTHSLFSPLSLFLYILLSSVPPIAPMAP